jgi:hypothetical protein
MCINDNGIVVDELISETGISERADNGASKTVE